MNLDGSIAMKQTAHNANLKSAAILATGVAAAATIAAKQWAQGGGAGKGKYYCVTVDISRPGFGHLGRATQPFHSKEQYETWARENEANGYKIKVVRAYWSSTPDNY